MILKVKSFHISIHILALLYHFLLFIHSLVISIFIFMWQLTPNVTASDELTSPYFLSPFRLFIISRIFFVKPWRVLQ